MVEHPFRRPLPRCRTRLLAASTVALVCAAQGSPEAYGQGAPFQSVKPGDRIGVDSPWARAAQAGRERMKAGDCASAIDAFDEALRHSVSATVRRDRGLCHEKLGHTAPAIDDFRDYLFRQPNASDAGDIRARLVRLEQATGQGASTTTAPTTGSGSRSPSSGSAASSVDDNPFAAKAASSAGVGVAVNGDADASTDGADASGIGAASAGSGDGTYAAKRAEVLRAGEGKQGTARLDALAAAEARQRDADGSPLRRGKGWVFGIYGTVRGWGEPGLGFGQTFGLSARYSLGKHHTLMAEVGYADINGEGGATGYSGLGTMFGYELRAGLDQFHTHNLYAGIGAGYEHMGQRGGGYVWATILGRARAGYRLVLGPSFGVELGVDGGPAGFIMLDPPPDAPLDFATFTVGGHLGAVVGF
jgi:hypothetical protein